MKGSSAAGLRGALDRLTFSCADEGGLMKPAAFRLVVLTLLLAATSVGWVLGQPPGVVRRPAETTAAQTKDKARPLPPDPRLLALHREFVQKAEKLAQEYEQKRDFDKAKACYEEILHLVPDYPAAKSALATLIEREFTAEKKVVDVHANRDWQDTGVVVVQGKPVRIKASGTWTLNMSYRLTPAGISIPEELRDFNLGSLIGVIAGGDPKAIKPFLIGEGTEFVAERTGRLLLRMYDNDVNDNVGKITVEISGSFGR
jgi:hypothetical protein